MHADHQIVELPSGIVSATVWMIPLSVCEEMTIECVPVAVTPPRSSGENVTLPVSRNEPRPHVADFANTGNGIVHACPVAVTVLVMLPPDVSHTAPLRSR